ncbi:hypothetical protein A1O7_06343 [Cladophialophora yegresii CBS 114405]|uniref:Nuclear pore complex protein n=1 Tax=Cladophialophora yegresii CBS 114405 TaxID=1182544 RepID=W9VTN7_9EURO|nr:uncharacterized protein A1O7_06343 [Cladophialophora yegresii CBS 114405]EXJ58913.1 hypothetical protein A1O7_06343 [Cladophialophora yegresii CBS 114405]
MAPVTRSSLYGRQSQLENNPSQEESNSPGDGREDQQMADEDDEESLHEGATENVEFLYTSQGGVELGRRAGSSMLIDTTDAQSPFRSSAQEMLRPLQDTAERVSRQVEEFAKALDRFVSNREPTDNSLWDDALVLLERYSKIADIRKAKTPAGEEQGELDKLQLESDLWILVRNLLYTNSPRNLNDVQIAQESRLAGLHRYSTNTELWTAFLDSDAVAQEYENILSWLQERAADTSPPVEELTRSLMDKSSRGDGIWSSGPIFTQSKIKQQKRTRVWSLPLEPSNPGLNRTHVRESDQTRLVTQLDPDARTRESAAFEDEDEYYDQATWQTYWEMLRRGKSNTEIQSWFSERKMLWKYASLCGGGTPTKQMIDSPWVRILNFATNSEWLERCRMLAQNPAVEDHFQRAVYGVLCGDFGASKSASKTIEDHLFSIFNSLLIQRYQHYLEAFRTRSSASTIPGYRPAAPSTEKIRQYLTVVQSDPSIKEEVHLPHKLIELAVMSKDFGNLFVTMGRAAAHVLYATGQGSQLMKKNEGEVNEVASLNAQDQDSVRMVAHLQLLLRSLGMLDSAYAQNEYELENNIAAYVGLLESLGRWLLIPLYASKLSKKRSYHVLGAILINVTDRRERDLQVKLMKQYNIDVSEVAYGIFSLANFADLQKLRHYKHGPISSKITMMGGTGKTAQHKIRPAMMSGDVPETELRAIRSVEWIRYVDAENWGLAAWSVGVLYKVFLLEGKFVALRQLLERVGLSVMSLAAVGMNLQFADADPPTGHIESEVDEMDEDHVKPMSSPSRKRKAAGTDTTSGKAKTDRQTLALQCLVWKQLEQLVAAIDALDIFQEVADALEQHKTNPSAARNYRRELKRTLDDVRQAMNPVLVDDFLCRPDDENEATVLDDIRNHYIPEVVLAYNSALWFAGHYVSRTWLVECMTLAQVVAETPMLTAVFVASGRMKELVRAFAVDSQALLQATEQSSAGGAGTGAGRAKKIRTEKGNADIWKVSWKEDYRALDLEAMD